MKTTASSLPSAVASAVKLGAAIALECARTGAETPVKLSGRRKLIKSANHRNGICGREFKVAIISEPDEEKIGKRRRMLAIYFPGDDCACAVFELEKLAKGDIKFGSNSWRGDRYADDMEKIK